MFARASRLVREPAFRRPACADKVRVVGIGPDVSAAATAVGAHVVQRHHFPAHPGVYEGGFPMPRGRSCNRGRDYVTLCLHLGPHASASARERRPCRGSALSPFLEGMNCLCR